MKRVNSPSDGAVLADLQAAQASEPLIISEPIAQPVQPAPQRTTQPRTIDPPAIVSLYEKATRSIALLFALAVGGALWYADGFFTLRTLEKIGLKLAGAGGWRWLIPVAITATTIALWPKARDDAQARARLSDDERRRRAQAWRLALLFFLAIVGFNIGTSFAGLVDWGKGRELPLFTGIVLPAAGWTLWALGGVGAVILAFGPERLWRWAAPDLWHLWRD